MNLAVNNTMINANHQASMKIMNKELQRFEKA
jgi:hypothetical protein